MDLMSILLKIRSSAITITAPIKGIEGPLMDGMNKVGDLFGAGEDVSPSSSKIGTSYEKAVAHLVPFIEKEKEKNNLKEIFKWNCFIGYRKR